MRIVMMGTGAFAVPTLERLLAGPHPVVGLVTQPERAVGEERGSTRQTGRSMAAIAREHGVPVFQPEKINDPAGVAGLQSFQPDLLVVAAYGQILSKEVLAVSTHGGINVHASLLPKYRGAAPVAWAIYHGETETGVTIIRMSVHLDAGDMLAQEAVEIGPEETAGELESRLAQVGAKLGIEVIERIATGTAKGIKQNAALATKAPKLKKEDGNIDWSRPAQAACNQIRAMQPWPTAYTFLYRADAAAERMIITRAVPAVKSADMPSQPGAIVPGNAASGRLLAATGENTVVEILEIQPAGKRRMRTAEFLPGHPLRPGDHFGRGPS
jgi:methionyl-tRNA formyltransferase